MAGTMSRHRKRTHAAQFELAEAKARLEAVQKENAKLRDEIKRLKEKVA